MAVFKYLFVLVLAGGTFSLPVEVNLSEDKAEHRTIDEDQVEHRTFADDNSSPIAFELPPPEPVPAADFPGQSSTYIGTEQPIQSYNSDQENSAAHTIAVVTPGPYYAQTLASQYGDLTPGPPAPTPSSAYFIQSATPQYVSPIEHNQFGPGPTLPMPTSVPVITHHGTIEPSHNGNQYIQRYVSNVPLNTGTTNVPNPELQSVRHPSNQESFVPDFVQQSDEPIHDLNPEQTGVRLPTNAQLFEQDFIQPSESDDFIQGSSQGIPLTISQFETDFGQSETDHSLQSSFPSNLLSPEIENPSRTAEPVPSHPREQFEVPQKSYEEPQDYYEESEEHFKQSHYQNYGSSAGPAMPYAFSYAVKDAYSGNDFSHRQESDGIITTGRYTVLLPDGRMQIVTFSADRGGYVADVTYKKAAKNPFVQQNREAESSINQLTNAKPSDTRNQNLHLLQPVLQQKTEHIYTHEQLPQQLPQQLLQQLPQQLPLKIEDFSHQETPNLEYPDPFDVNNQQETGIPLPVIANGGNGQELQEQNYHQSYSPIETQTYQVDQDSSYQEGPDSSYQEDQHSSYQEDQHSSYQEDQDSSYQNDKAIVQEEKEVPRPPSAQLRKSKSSTLQRNSGNRSKSPKPSNQKSTPQSRHNSHYQANQNGRAL